MKVCIVAEGCYPYVVGGVSGWINSLIKSFPNVEFILLAIVANRSFRGKFVYELPENLTQVYEVYLEDSEWEGGDRKRKRRKKVHISRKEYDELLNMVLNRKTDWGVIFDLFHKKRLSVDDLLMGEDFFLIARECYNRNYSNINFSDFLWTLRSIYLPMFWTLKMDVPKADLYHCVATGYSGILGSMAKHFHGSRLPGSGAYIKISGSSSLRRCLFWPMRKRTLSPVCMIMQGSFRSSLAARKKKSK